MSRERRAHHRLLQPFPLRYREQGRLGSSWTTVATMNLSAGGARFIGPEPVDCGAVVELQIELPNQKTPLTVKGLVVWSQMEASGATEHGIQFTEISAEQQMQIDAMVRFLNRGSGASTA